MPRLPIPGGDEGNWGEILNEFLLASHAADGSLLAASSISSIGSLNSSVSTNTSDIASLTSTVAAKYTRPSTGIPESDLTSAVQAKLNSGGGGGTTDHGALTGLSDDDHTQYALADGSRGDFEPTGTSTTAANAAVSTHTGAADPHPQYLTQTEGDARYVQPAGVPSAASDLSDIFTTGITDGQVLQWSAGNSRFQPATIAGGGGSTDHGALTGLGDDDHTQYYNQARGDARYLQIANAVTDIDDLSDVSTSGVANGHVLTYSGGSWGTAAPSGGGATNLSWSAATATVASSTGTNAVITSATTTNPGLMSATDKSKLDGVETGATADQTGAQIKAAYEGQANTNAFTDANVTKLGALNTSAQVPAGGTSGQVLKKSSGTDYDYAWTADATGGGGGSSTITTLTTSGGVLNIDLSVNTSFYVNAAENITTVNVTNGPSNPNLVEWVLVIAGNGANRNVTFPSAWKMPGGTKTYTVNNGESRVLAVLDTGATLRANISENLA